MFAYIGYDFMIVLSDEAKDPQKNVPKSISLSFLITMFLYVMTSISIYGICRLEELGSSETAIATAFENIGLNWMSFVVSLAAFMGISVALFTVFMCMPRVISSISQDGLFFS